MTNKKRKWKVCLSIQFADGIWPGLLTGKERNPRCRLFHRCRLHSFPPNPHHATRGTLGLSSLNKEWNTAGQSLERVSWIREAMTTFHHHVWRTDYGQNGVIVCVVVKILTWYFKTLWLPQPQEDHAVSNVANLAGQVTAQVTVQYYGSNLTTARDVETTRGYPLSQNILNPIWPMILEYKRTVNK